MLGKPGYGEGGLEYELYCFKAVNGSSMLEEDDEIEAYERLRNSAEKQGLAAMSDDDGDAYWFGCLPDQKDLYALVDKYFEQFKAIGCIEGGSPAVQTANYDGMEYNSFGEEVEDLEE